MEHVNVYQTDVRPLLGMTVGCNVTLLAEAEAVHSLNFIASCSDRLAAPTISARERSSTRLVFAAAGLHRRF